MAAPRKTTTISSREFNQNTSGAKRAALEGPVIITDRGRETHVLLSAEDYHRLAPDAPKRRISLLEAMEQKGGPEYDFDIEFPRLPSIARPIDLGDD